MAGRVAQNKRAVNDRQSAASNDALKNAKDHVMQNFELIADLDNSDGKFTKIVEAGLATAKMVLSAEIYQNVIKTVLERELQTWKIVRENAIFEATKEAEERKAEMDDKDEEGSSSASSSSSSSLSSSNAGTKRGRDGPARDIVDDRLGFTKDDTDKLIKRIRQLTEVLLEQQKPKLDKEKFYQDLVKKVAQQADDADDNAEIKEVKTAPKDSDFECPFGKCVIEVPMTNGKCRHIIDETSLKSMCRPGKEAQCPVVGCKQKWSLGTANMDVEFKRKLDRYNRVKASQHQERDDAIDLDDGDDGYTNMA